MGNIIRHCRRFIREEFHLNLYLTVALFLGLTVWANYHFQIEKRWIDSLYGEWIQIPVYFTFYSVPYLFALFAWAHFTRNWKALRERGYWGYLLFALLLLSVRSWFHYHQPLASLLFEKPAWAWGTKLLWNMKSSLFYLIPLFVFWQILDRAEMKNLYGLTRKNFEARPYFILLLFVLPAVAWASFQPAFMQSYPQYTPGTMEVAMGWNQWVTTGILQFFYGLDFTFVELFFRGFLVIGMVKWLGPGAVLPMVTTYCFLHFGKPAAEAVSSIIGGYLLGIFAYYSRSILGGVIVHWGVAWMMELCAYMQLLLIWD